MPYPKASELATIRDARKKRRDNAFRSAQRAMSKFILKRDPICVTCGKRRATEMGHYVHGKHGALYFCDYNVHGQCHECNQHKGGNHTAYHTYMLRKYGTATTELVESIGKRQSAFDVEDLRTIRHKYEQADPRSQFRLFFGMLVV